MTKQKTVLIFSIILLVTGAIIATVISGQSFVNGGSQQVNGLPGVNTRGLEPNIQVMGPEKPSTVLWKEQKTALLLSDNQPTLSELGVSRYDKQINEQVIDQSEQQVHVLIQKYNDHLSDRETREDIENQVAQIAQNYKQSVLLKVKQLNNKPQ